MSLTCTAYRYCALLTGLLWCTSLSAQDTVLIKTYRMASVDTIVATHSPADSFYWQTKAQQASFLKKRQSFLSYTNVAVYTGALVLLNSAWYTAYPRSSFHIFNDNAEWLQVDKVGHAWSAYGLSRATYGAWKWAGVSNKKAVLLAGISGPGFLTVIETLDGFSSGWGWSWGDMGANVFGGGLFVGQQLGWGEQRIDFKFSAHKINYPASLISRTNNLYGKSLPERILKDYNGQTYWLSANLKSFFKKSNLPAWLNVAVGYGASGLLGANSNSWKDAGGNETTRYDIARTRQWYLAPDIKFSKIKTKSKLLRTVFFALDAVKFPLPGLQWQQGSLEIKGLLF